MHPLSQKLSVHSLSGLCTKHILSVFWTSPMLTAKMLDIAKARSYSCLNFQVIMTLNIFLQCLGVLNNGYVYMCTHTKHFGSNSENLNKFHYLCVPISSFIILKMESARFSVLTIIEPMPEKVMWFSSEFSPEFGTHNLFLIY